MEFHLHYAIDYSRPNRELHDSEYEWQKAVRVQNILRFGSITRRLGISKSFVYKFGAQFPENADETNEISANVPNVIKTYETLLRRPSIPLADVFCLPVIRKFLLKHSIAHFSHDGPVLKYYMLTLVLSNECKDWPEIKHFFLNVLEKLPVIIFFLFDPKERNRQLSLRTPGRLCSFLIPKKPFR